MKRISQAVATAALLSLSVLGMPAPASATPTQDHLTQAQESASGDVGAAPSQRKADLMVDVVVMLKKQPSSPAASVEQANIKLQRELANRWHHDFGFEAQRHFGYLANGMSGRISSRNAHKLMKQPEVASVKRERRYKPAEHAARDLEGVQRAFSQRGVDGTGMVVAIVDTGIDAQHKDMRLDDCSKAKIKKIDTSHPEGNFSCKVPMGYNYADENYTVKDTTASQHGMHVAGIVAANGSEGDAAAWDAHRIDGVAPNAQLLAMKVFSNHQGSTAGDADIIAAIEDSVKLGADVINMSLGSSNGQKNASDGMSRAIQTARQAGVITVVAAGNEGLNFSPDGTTDDAFGLFDDGTVGSPGTQGSAFTVASLDNSQVTQPQGFYNDGTNHAFAYFPHVGEADGSAHRVVAVGKGREQDYKGNVDLADAFALIERGEISFTEKFQRAVDHGAYGVIVYNNVSGSEEMPGMAGVDEFDVVGASIRNADGLAILEATKKGEVTLRLTKDVAAEESANGLKPSNFTSWGTTPTLDFEPEIAGIGGNVYSTLNDNSYGSMSGTSMASPNVAGLVTLMMEDAKKTMPQASAAQRMAHAEAALMNTALIPTHDDIPYAPRQVGAGLARVDKALDTDVLATVDSVPSVALREVKGPRQFTVTLTNSGTQPRVFDVPRQQVINESNAKGQQTITSLSAETLTADTREVTVPAGGSASVTFTLTPDTSRPHFIEGWARFESKDAKQPDLSVPYFGFVGDWNAEPIVKAPGQPWSDTDDTETGLVSMIDDEPVLFRSSGSDDVAWLSPNGDGKLDELMSDLLLMRNASDLVYEIVKADTGEVVKILGHENDVVRPTLSMLQDGAVSPAYSGVASTWDGKLYNPQTGHDEPAPDGAYIYRVRTRLGAAYEWQVINMPVNVDTSAPKITITSVKNGVVSFTVTDEGSGLEDQPTVETVDGRKVAVSGSNGTYTATLPEPDAAFIIRVSDQAGNEATATRAQGSGRLVLLDRADLEKPLGPASPSVTDDAVTIRGAVTDDIVRVEVNGEEAALEEGVFSAEVALETGENAVSVVGYAADGRRLAHEELTLLYDNQPPVIEVTNLNENQALEVSEDGSVRVEGKVTDERAGAADIKVTVVDQEVTLNGDGTFAVTVTLPEGVPYVAIEADDGVNQQSYLAPISTFVDDEKTAVLDRMPEFTNVVCMFGACFVPKSGEDVGPDFFVLRGVAKPGTTVTIQPASRAGNGEMVDPEPLTAGEGEFALRLPMFTGDNSFNIVVKDEAGKVILEQPLLISYDRVAPTLRVDNPTLYGGTLFTNSDTTRFTGTASDDGYGYALSLNGSRIIQLYYSGKGPESNERTFDEEIKVKDGDTIQVTITDGTNSMTARIPVVVDKEAPKAEITGVEDNEIIASPRDVTTTVTDPNLARMRVLVDEQEVAAPVTSLVAAKDTVDSHLVTDVRPRNDSGEVVGIGGASVGREKTVADEPAPGEGNSEPIDEELMNQLLESIMGAVPAEGKVDPAHPTPTTLTHTFSTEGMAPGVHRVSVEGIDLAGNRTIETRSFIVKEPVDVSPENPGAGDGTIVEVDRDDLADNDKLKESVEDALGGDVTIEVGGDGSLHEGPNTVTVIVTNPDGTTTRRDEVVTVVVRERTLTDNGVEARGPFRSDDALKVSLERVGEMTTVRIDHQSGLADVEATLRIPAAQGASLCRALQDGSCVPVAATWADGAFTLRGTVPSVYVVTDPGATPPKGRPHVGDALKPGVDHRGDAGGDGRVQHAAASSVNGDSSGDLAKTGANATGMSALAVMGFVAGLVMVQARRRRS